MKPVSRCLAVTSIFIAVAGCAWAADAPAQSPMKGAGAPQHALHDPVAAAQQRLDSLGKKLNLKSSQQDAWKSFSDVMLKLAQEHAQEKEKHSFGNLAKLKELSAPDKLAAIAAKMRKGADSLSKLAGDTRLLYDQLSPEQKTIFDLYAKNVWNERMLHRKQHRMP